jgi:leukotriene-A4 hydrolase
VNYILSGLLIITLFACNRQKKEEQSKNNSTMTTRDPHSYARPEEAVVTHLSLNLDIDFDKHIFKGVAVLSIKIFNDAKQIILDTRDLKIEKITNDAGIPLQFELGKKDQFLGEALTIQIQDEKTISVFYSTSDSAAAVQWLTAEQTAGKTADFMFTQSQAILARTWVPIQDSPGIRFTYDAKVTVPANMMALMSAENPQTKNSNGTYSFNMPQPVPAYLLALVAGDVVFKSIDSRSGVYAESVTIDKAVNEFADLPKMISAAENLYGKYEWGRYDLIILPPSFPFGGMENPRLTFATPTILAGDRSLTTLVAHELAHSWSGNLVTNATWNDFWMNEGFTVYFENRIMEALYGKDYTDMQKVLGFEDLKSTMAELGETSNDTRLKLILDNRDPDDGMNDIAYEKGHCLLLLIEKTVGREKFDRFLKSYFQRHAFKTISTEQFLKEYDEELIEGNKALADSIRIEDWIYKPGLPSNFLMTVSQKFIQVEKQAKDWINGKPAKELSTQNYSTYEWLRFIGNLPSTISHERMLELDDAFHFSETGNSEILFAWLELAIKNNYKEAYPALKQFLINVGRRKFVKPLFMEMVKTPEGKKMAKEIFAVARPNYHSITAKTIEDILNR